MKQILIKTLLFILISGITFPKGMDPQAQTTPDKIVDVKVNPKTKTIKPGSVVELDVVLNIKDGWHINANKPFDKNLIPTIASVKDTSVYKIEKIEYPQPVIMNLAFSEDELALYEAEAVIKMWVKINKNFKKNKILINGQVQFQPCNDQTCLFPFTKQFTVDLGIVKK